VHFTATAPKKKLSEIGRITEPILVAAGATSSRRDERAVELCECMMDVTAALFNVSSKEMRRPGRTSQDVARVRQIAMYVTHVILGMSMKEVGRGFGRDRTTVVHACHLIEDMREEADFDQVVAMTERVALAAFRERVGL
jgi:chromosomal replication initiation ATPase DnaA